MANILAIITLISASIYGLSMLNQTVPAPNSHSQKGGRRKTKKNRRK